MMRHIWGCVQVLVTILGLLHKSAHGNIKAVEARKAMIMDETDKILNERDADHQIEERGSPKKDRNGCYPRTTQREKCVFPFIYGGALYTSCTDRAHSGTYWCATETNNGHYIRGKWGNCECPGCAGRNQLSGSKGCCRHLDNVGGTCKPKNEKWRDWHMHVTKICTSCLCYHNCLFF